MSEKLVVGIADMKMAQNEGMLVTYALGSCIGICLYDPAIRLAALIHVMLPLNERKWFCFFWNVFLGKFLRPVPQQKLPPGSYPEDYPDLPQ